MKTQQKEPIIYALFTGPDELQRALKKLVAAGIDLDNISVLMDEGVRDRDFAAVDQHRTKDGIVAGSFMGGAVGGLIGGLLGLATSITGIGLIVVGPMVALAAAGGLIGGLVGHGVPEEEAHHLQRELRDGKAMIAVHAKGASEVQIARGVLKEEQAEELELRA
jgi:hypothetical protein